MEESQLRKTGTTTVGIVCKEAIILAADRKMTLGGMIVSSKKFRKIVGINENFAMTVAGLVSDVQLLTRLIKAQIRLDELRKSTNTRFRSDPRLNYEGIAYLECPLLSGKC